MLICVFTGFASGLPLYTLIQLVPAWLRDQGVDLATIGLFTLVQLPYVWKFLWAPLLDHFRLPWLGRRRGWMLVTQLGLLASVAALGYLRPGSDIDSIAALALVVAIFSATQDIVLDAYRRELLPDRELGLGNSIHVQTYRIAGLVPGALALVLADHIPWSTVFVVVALFMLVGIGLTLAISELIEPSALPGGFRGVVVEPFADLVARHGGQTTLGIIAFMVLYKLGDNMATALSTPFYLDLGFTKTEIGLIAKNAALWPSIIGGIAGGLLMVRIGINRALWLFGVIQLVTILGFAALARAGHAPVLMAVVIAFEYLGVGLGTAALTAFIARVTNPVYAGTQFALLTAIAALPRSVASAFTGVLVDTVGWPHFFLICAALALPGMALLLKVAPWNDVEEAQPFRAASGDGAARPAGRES